MLACKAVERILRLAVLDRKNSLFYRTEHGAAVGDIIASLVASCRLNQVGAWDALLALVRTARAVRAAPAAWLPWTYPRDAGGAFVPEDEHGARERIFVEFRPAQPRQRIDTLPQILRLDAHQNLTLRDELDNATTAAKDAMSSSALAELAAGTASVSAVPSGRSSVRRTRSTGSARSDAVGLAARSSEAVVRNSTKVGFDARRVDGAVDSLRRRARNRLRLSPSSRATAATLYGPTRDAASAHRWEGRRPRPEPCARQ